MSQQSGRHIFVVPVEVPISTQGFPRVTKFRRDRERLQVPCDYRISVFGVSALGLVSSLPGDVAQVIESVKPGRVPIAPYRLHGVTADSFNTQELESFSS